MTQDRKILKIEIVLASGHVVTTFTFADGYDVQFNEQGECSHYHLEIPDGLPVTRIACKHIAAVIERSAQIDYYGNIT